MKLNKKYKPTTSLQLIKKKGENPDAFFPIFVPAYRKFSSTDLAFQHYALIFSRNMQQFAHKTYAPLALCGLEYADYKLALPVKKQLPLFAQLQRFSQLEQKNVKKNQTFLEQFFPDFSVLKQDRTKDHHAVIGQALALLADKDVIKQDFRLVYRDTTTQSIVNTDDIEWKKSKVQKLEIKCFVETKKEVLPLMVDDLLTFFVDQAVVVHSDDRRYKKHIGKKIILPIINKSIPVYAQEGIDTLTDNGILRVNPLLNQEALARAKNYKADLEYNSIDHQGKIIKQLQDFAGQSLENFEENIIESLDMIGNLASKEEVEKLIPYSKITGQRLIKRVEKLYTIDLGEKNQDFKERLESTHPQFSHLLSQQDNFRFPLQSKGNFLPVILQQGGVKLSSLQLDDLLSEQATVFELLLLLMYAKGYCTQQMKLEELIDMVYLLPQQIWSELAEVSTRFSNEQILDYQKDLLSASPEELYDRLMQELSAISRVHKKEKSEFSFLLRSLLEKKEIEFLQMDTVFLKAAHLWKINTSVSEQLAFFAPYAKKQTLILLILLFLSEEEKGLIGLREIKELNYQWPITEKIQQLAQEYTRDAIYLTMADQIKLEEKALLDAQSYIQHLRNLFKFLYENGAFEKLTEQSGFRAIDMRAYTQRGEIFECYQKYQKSGTGIAELLKQLQAFTQGEFSRYLEFLKNEKQQAFQVAAEIFIQILQIFQPYLPFLMQEIASILERPLTTTLDQAKKEGQKDYKLNLLFEVVKGIAEYKKQLQIKKHQAIKLYIQANMERAALLEEHLPLLKILLKIQEIQTLSNAETFPSHLQVFQLLDMQVACELLAVHEEDDSLPTLEKKLSDLQQHLEYVRQTLMMLSTSPIPQPQKIAEKEQEMQTIKEEMENLEIKIKKIKAQKK